MRNLEKWKEIISDGTLDGEIIRLYGEKDINRKRYIAALDGYEQYFANGNGREIMIFTAPGRTEIGGNHTDHQHGRVLAGSVNLDIIGIVSLNGTNTVRIKSEGYPEDAVDITDLCVHPEEKNRSSSLIRGVLARFAQMGCGLQGFDAYTVSTVLKGSGLSSSAAFEVLIGSIVNDLFNGGNASPVEIAQIGQFAEREYFGKPSGLMDQTASSVGNMVTIDFENTENPIVEQVHFDFSKSGHALCIIDSGADHADLTDEYAVVTNELKLICGFFGKKVLREIPREDVMANIAQLRKIAGDRAVLRAVHFYDDNDRVPMQVEALKNNDFERFLKLVSESGRSSWMYLQNVIPAGYTEHQDVALALMLCDKLLNGRGAYRVHGGGFAGTVQAFVPLDILDGFKNGIESVLGKDSCHVLMIRPEGHYRIEI